MPAAGPSRRRREPSADEIEEPQDTAPAPDDVEESTQPRRGKKAQRAREEDDEEDDGGPVEDLLANFGDQPLGREQAAKLAGMAGDWGLTRQAIRVATFALVTEVANSVAEFVEGEKGEKALTELDTIMRELIDVDHQAQASEKTLYELNQKVAQQEEVTDILDRYQQESKTKMTAYKSKTTRQKYAKEEEYIKFKSAIYEVQHPDTAMPPLADLIPREDGDDSDEDDDVQVGGITQDYKCPLTLTTLVEPLTSLLCGHSFSAAAIQEYLGPSRMARKECPASGCHKHLSLSDLRPDKQLAKKARDAARRERMREENDDAEEVVE